MTTTNDASIAQSRRTDICIDCGHPTHCGQPHGSGHDHSPEAQACTARALAEA